MEIDALVNNAGVGVFGEFGEETDLNDELAMIQLNVVSVVHLTKLFLPLMIKRGSGKILITASIVAITSNPLLTVYAGTKAFDYIFAEGLRDEVKDKGITVTALLPGGTNTNFFKRARMEDTELWKHRDSLADPVDVAKEAFKALMDNKDHVIAGFKNKVQAAIADVMPKEMTAHNERPKRVSTNK
jgi:short-subunit dehydrogenase